MDLQQKSPIAGSRDELVVREAFAGHVLFSLTLFAIGVGWCATPLLSPWGWIPALILGLPCLGVALVLGSGLARAWRAPKWVLRCEAGSISLALRSAWNADLELDESTAVRLDADEILELCPVTRTELLPGSEQGSSLQRRQRWLEIRLTHERTDELDRALVRERERRGVGRTHHNVVHVELVRPDTLRVNWGGLRPRLDSALLTLGKHHSVRPARDEGTHDATQLAGEELDEAAFALADAGRMVDAVRLLCAQAGLSTTEAKARLVTRKAREAA